MNNSILSASDIHRFNALSPESRAAIAAHVTHICDMIAQGATEEEQQAYIASVTPRRAAVVMPEPLAS